MPFFDFHVHPALKPQFDDIAERYTPWDDFKLKFPIIDSQSSLAQLRNGEVNLIGIALHVPEPQMAVQLNNIVHSESLAVKIFRIIKHATFVKLGSFLSDGRLRQLGDANVNSYQVLLEELDNLQSHRTGPYAGDELVLLKAATDYDAQAPRGKLFGFFVVEGLHCFKGAHALNTDEGIAEVKNNITNLCSRPDMRVLAVNVAHLQYNHICNHAFGIKLFDDAPFYPTGDGIVNMTAFGSIVQMLYDRNILVDIKHMSAKARAAFYEWRAQHYPDRPLVCTHAGIAGGERATTGRFVFKRPKRVQQDPVMYSVELFKPLGLVPRTSFNTSSINLYDEDIEAILRSGGLIGISLDRRIIGFTESFHDEEITDMEYLSVGEYRFMFGDGPSMDCGPDEVLTADTHTTDDQQDWELLDARYFLNQVFHIINVARSKGLAAEAARGICIGSDFDGMIDAAWCCRTADRMLLFKQRVSDILRDTAEECGMDLAGFDNLVENIFLNNGKAFVLGRIDSIRV